MAPSGRIKKENVQVVALDPAPAPHLATVFFNARAGGPGPLGPSTRPGYHHPRIKKNKNHFY